MVWRLLLAGNIRMNARAAVAPPRPLQPDSVAFKTGLR
jgi:hypothetical protein